MFREGRSSYPKWFVSRDIECKDSPVHGAGIFATKDIPKHTMIESSPCLVLHQNSMEALHEINDSRHILQDYVFHWDPGFVAVAMGWVAIYNHDDDSNCQWRPNLELKSLEITTIKDVKAGEELFIKYLPAKLSSLLWFEQEGKEIRREDMEYAWHKMKQTPDWKKL
tara:strand:- start:83 stop:583 length:501 start_codon:yes stop_codon:yes gene_type:complete